jgi:hypothetical protein
MKKDKEHYTLLFLSLEDTNRKNIVFADYTKFQTEEYLTVNSRFFQ